MLPNNISTNKWGFWEVIIHLCLKRVKNHKFRFENQAPLPMFIDERLCLSKDLIFHPKGMIKEFASLTNLKNALKNEGFRGLEVKLLRGRLWVLLELSTVKSKEAFRDHVGSLSSWISEIRHASSINNKFHDVRIVWVKDVMVYHCKLWTVEHFSKDCHHVWELHSKHIMNSWMGIVNIPEAIQEDKDGGD
ncbi:hypothetical protein Tco_1146952 [Tanacetum coccineum]